MQYYSFRAMNTEVLMAAEGRHERLEVGFRKTREFIEACERRFTRFSPDSELSALNRQTGRWFRASPDLFAVVHLAAELSEKTDGLFDPSVLASLEAVGYDRSMDELRAEGAAPVATADVAVRTGGFREVRLDRESYSIWLPPGARIDLGGIAKGWIAERAAGMLATYAPACAINAGGDLFLCGLPTGLPHWQVSLEDPRNPEQTLAALRVPPGAVATSSVTRRRWLQGGQERHHLIDPRTGQPAKSEWLSVTVIASHAAEAEVYAKALLIAGPQGASDLVGRVNGLAYIAVDREGRLWGSTVSKEYL